MQPGIYREPAGNNQCSGYSPTASLQGVGPDQPDAERWIGVSYGGAKRRGPAPQNWQSVLGRSPPGALGHRGGRGLAAPHTPTTASRLDVVID